MQTGQTKRWVHVVCTRGGTNMKPSCMRVRLQVSVRVCVARARAPALSIHLENMELAVYQTGFTADKCGGTRFLPVQWLCQPLSMIR